MPRFLNRASLPEPFTTSVSSPSLKLIRLELSPIHMVLKVPLGIAREAYNKMLGEFPVARGFTFNEIEIEGVKAEYGQPPEAIPGRVVLFLHGGGYVLGCAKSYRAIASEVAARLKSAVLIPDYRLAPEHPFPAALEDASKSYRWLLAKGYAPEGIVVVGDSAGGGLTLCMLQALREVGIAMPAAAAVMSPWTDLELTGQTMTSKAGVDEMLTPEALGKMARSYLENTPSRWPTASPLYGDLRGFPPLLIQVGSEEILLEDSVRLAGLAGAAQVQVRLSIWPGMFHIFQVFSSRLDTAREALDEMGKFLSARLKK